MDDHNKYMTVRAAAAMIGLSESTLRRMIRRGDVPAFRPGKRKLLLEVGLVNAFVKARPAFKHADAMGVPLPEMIATLAV
jgi:excisionase family DNA binding protein